MRLTNAEEKIMNYLWKLDKAFFKDIINLFPDPKPAVTTVNTLLKRMIDKGFVDYKLYGNSRQYYPRIKKSKYFSKHINKLIKDYFDNSVPQFASFFTKETNLNRKELKKLRNIIDGELKSKKK